MGSMTVYGATPNALELIREMGQSIHKSGIAGCDNEDQGRVLAMTCVAKGVDPLSLAERYDIIKGKLSMKSTIMLAEFEARGGTFKQIQRDADAAVIELTKDGRTERYSLTWEEAKQEPFIYNGKESDIIKLLAANNQKSLAERIKPKYATPRSRTQMLWARVISDAVRAMDPGVCGGVYTPEEVSDFDSSEHRQVESPAVVDSAPSASPATASATEEVTDAEFEPKQETESDKPIESTTSAPCEQTQIDKIKSLLKQVAQLEGNADIGAKVKQKFYDSGLRGWNDLSYADAELLIQALSKRNVQLFFDAALTGHKSPGEQS